MTKAEFKRRMDKAREYEKRNRNGACAAILGVLSYAEVYGYSISDAFSKMVSPLFLDHLRMPHAGPIFWLGSLTPFKYDLDARLEALDLFEWIVLESKMYEDIEWEY